MFNTSKIISPRLMLSLRLLLLAGCVTFGPSTNGQRIGFVKAMDLSLREGDLSHTDELLPHEKYFNRLTVWELTRTTARQFEKDVRRRLISIRRLAIEQGFKWEKSELTGTYIEKVDLTNIRLPESIENWGLSYPVRNSNIPFEELLPSLDKLSDEYKLDGRVFLRFEDPERIAVVKGWTTVQAKKRVIDPTLFDWHLYEVSPRGRRSKDGSAVQP